ncbi:hypothetical protein GUITHDRAFT_115536 [Guillardia theta CCMP2712]|uniref:Uncharacterized protein n=1 Tax=Guillardia theta (strain CCMP2712) TaxID=905079 RepID=L1IQP9_GUITC|nr:hypothetical protein GUITHDRAFT_115536 [Guillardia theta CCMP2712]EKX38397.1 hypothetical protein GUITHDRAFT_115536 [Guillardia theta CCMP2712]|eukprot:XP_005825377.1 hypothetical protein GUITHDRAFT_115536 [Guillardia theta CCMP2712]
MRFLAKKRKKKDKDKASKDDNENGGMENSQSKYYEPHLASIGRPFECSSGKDCWCAGGLLPNDKKFDLSGANACLLEASFRNTLIKELQGSHKKTGITPLHYAARNLNKKSIKLLLEAKANPMIVDIHGNTPLHFAAMASYSNRQKGKDAIRALVSAKKKLAKCKTAQDLIVEPAEEFYKSSKEMLENSRSDAVRSKIQEAVALTEEVTKFARLHLNPSK